MRFPNLPAAGRLPVRGGLFLALGIGLALPGSVPAGPSEAGYRESIVSWQREREERLRSETGWLTIAGLFWLEPGIHSFGSDPENALVLSAGPPRAGRLRVLSGEEGTEVRVDPEPGVELRQDGEVLPPGALIFATGRESSPIRIDRLEFWIIERGDRYAVRIRDPEYPLRKQFRGIETYPVDRAYRVEGNLKNQDAPTTVLLPNIVGFVDSVYTPGPVEFELLGRRLSLWPVTEGPADSTLFFVFADETTGTETYEGGRFLYANIEPEGRIVLDFNRAYNPPCAFNPNTTCPVPPEGNTLPVPVRAGEKDYAREND